MKLPAASRRVSAEFCRSHHSFALRASEDSPRLAYSAEAATSAAKAGHPRKQVSGVFGEGE